MVTISISAEAFAALAATLPTEREADARPEGRGGFKITLPPNVIAKLKAMRGAGESHSDVIIKITKDV